jgi:hypothetical protein
MDDLRFRLTPEPLANRPDGACPVSLDHRERLHGSPFQAEEFRDTTPNALHSTDVEQARRWTLKSASR